ncbi:WXG100 family type VII secretion target [Clostridium acidisoli DSM 12555]|jgi:WXG100 family type VII secretion target|uniref:ESAT-6-like protein n=1 Tax=Clostridium acidisoli DSM 12555 TaxID=1121291 RepID=A0A1W1Y014_9CLOT|nr:WXG100 family type VII secretion target [Clostridium acidisoli]SMC29559.1 WXG100 family type VII secretion target [Clostridium acidisoli DSM 12555]
METISINIEDFNRTADLFVKAADTCKAHEANVEAATSELIESWKGDSKNEFQYKYSEVKKGMYNYDSMLREISKELKAIAGSFEKVDSDIERSIKNS